MRRRLGLTSAIAGMLALVLASAPVAAGGTYNWSVSGIVCTLNGGAYGQGYVKARPYMEEIGRSGTRQFHMTAYLQEKSVSGGGWYNVDQRDYWSPPFPNNYTSYWVDHVFKLNVGDNTYWHRMQVWFDWWGSSSLLWSSYWNSRKC